MTWDAISTFHLNPFKLSPQITLMSPREQTAWPAQGNILADFYKQGASYTNWRPRGSGYYLLIYTLAGAGKFVTSAGTRESSIGEVVLYSPHEAQDYSTSPNAGKWDLLWVHFTAKPDWRLWLEWKRNELNLQIISLGGKSKIRFTGALREVILTSRLPFPQAPDLAASALEKALIWANIAQGHQKGAGMDPRVLKAIGYLTGHIREPFRVETLARACHTSPSHLSHLFKKGTQTTPQKFLESHRIQQAAALLRITRRSIAQIGEEVGYPDPAYFSTTFRRAMGMSPSAYRESQFGN